MSKKILFTIILTFFSTTLLADTSSPMQTDVVVAEKCQDLNCVRVQIDTLDTQILQLLGQRLAYVKRAGELKSGKTASVHDQAREDKILTTVGLEAKALGYPASIAQAVFKEVLVQSVQYEEQFHRD